MMQCVFIPKFIPMNCSSYTYMFDKTTNQIQQILLYSQIFLPKYFKPYSSFVCCKLSAEF